MIKLIVYFELILAVCIGTAVASGLTQLETEELRINVDEISSNFQGSLKKQKYVVL